MDIINMKVYKTINCLSCCWCSEGINKISLNTEVPISSLQRCFENYREILLTPLYNDDVMSG